MEPLLRQSDPLAARKHEQRIAVAARKYSLTLLAYIESVVRNPDDAQDVLQDVWLQVLKKHRTFTGRGPFADWVFVIAKNACLMFLRKPEHRREKRYLARGVWPLWYGAGSHTVGPDVYAARSALWTDTQRALSKLAARQRDVVILRVLEGCSTKETTAALGCTTGTVKAYLHRALQHLRTHLAHWQ